MGLYEEAEKFSVLGLQGYRFGLFVMLGMAAAAGVIAFLSWARRMKKGTAPLLTLLSILLGGLFSRLFFCLMNQELGAMMPPASWLRITGGGWSMTGVVAGVMLAAWITSLITRQPMGSLADPAACALPAFMALERFGESGVPEFDFSRRLTTELLNGSFLTFGEYDGYYLATWKLAGIVMLILLAVLILHMTRSRHEGDTCILFLILFGAVSVILESLRYDRFLSITFVGLQHVAAAVILCVGVVLAACRYVSQERNGKGKKGIVPLAFGTVLAAAGIAVGLEFALDRTSWNALLVYAVYILVMAVPAVMGILLLHKTK